MTTENKAPWPLVPVAQAARMVGVSTARVYQRISESAEGTRIPAVVVPRQRSDGRELAPRLRVDILTVLEWRRERELAGHEVGPVAPQFERFVVPVPPARPTPAELVGSVGMPSTRPF